jgi:uncharacterized membrane protein
MNLPSYNWIVGVLLGSLASFISNLGVTLQKLSHIQNAKETSSVRANYAKQSLWRMGLGLVVFGSFADFSALSFAPQSLIAPLGSLTLVSNSIFAPLLLKETIGPRDLLSSFSIVLGSSISVAFASHEDKLFSIPELFSFYERAHFLIYAAFISVAIIVMYVGLQQLEHMEVHDRERYEVAYHMLWFTSHRLACDAGLPLHSPLPLSVHLWHDRRAVRALRQGL